ncbi:MAG: PQQ-dependent dehydrogenase, methanol/ethanol family [Deltaproteobacteria bacterium]|nr:PQQ-dependent dehydrogenase, methanol/ethanol family [Deltaproteobacteria bacterium]MBW2448243.1 PQQ-dependent dehydrogenase, methanol/ethanol family [Deltaproteobacteria bacterium]
MHRGFVFVGLVTALLGLGCGGEDAAAPVAEPAHPAAEAEAAPARQGVAAVDDARLRGAGGEANNWLSHGRDYAEQRFSPLEQVNDTNASGLLRAWTFETGLTRGHEATPIVVDGRMYLTGSWSVVFALDARTGELLWKHDPLVPRETAVKACCDVVNRGVAVYRGLVYVGALDGRLLALDAETGQVVWEVVTVDQEKDYTVTGAPRIVKGKVMIGNGGAEFGVRGYISAYDALTGELAWRTYTVPGDPSKPFESEALEQAAKTWTGEWWKRGGGGTAWDSMAFDASLDLLYVGTGNGSPWSRYARSPDGGDNLYVSSILALDPDTGELAWHFQTTPGDNWDYTATQHMILADLMIDGRLRKVIMQAPKNGFFWVIDRMDGSFISAEPYVTVTWADGVDPKTGRPIPNGSGEYRDGLALVRPTAFGGHNWQPMSFNPRTGLVYIPAQEILGAYMMEKELLDRPKHFNTGSDFAVFATLTREVVSGHLLAWDPVNQKEAWRHPYAMPWNGGTLTTAGNLVFQGTADGRFLALRADDGQKLWEAHAGSGVIAAPVTYAVDGVQYVTVVAGWGGAFALAGGDAAAQAGVVSRGIVNTYALSDQPITPALVSELLASRPEPYRGRENLFHTWCARCHGSRAVGSGVLADLRYSVGRLGESFETIVRHGVSGLGMPGFDGILDEEEIRELRAYLETRAEQDGIAP